MSKVFGWVIIPLLSTVLAFPILKIHDDDGAKELVNVQLLRHHSDHRVRREAGVSSMPDVIVTQFQLSDNDVILRLRRVSYPKTYTFGDVIEEYTQSTPESSVYVDPSRSAAFMVTKSKYDDYILEGNLYHEGKQLYLRPTRSRRSADDRNEHAVSPLVDSTAIDFGHDYFYVDASNNSDNTGITDGGSHRRRRQAQTPIVHTVETTVVADFSDYSNWNTQSPNDTVTQMRTYFTYIAASMSNIYKSVNKIDSSIDVVPVITNFVVLTTPQASSFSESLHTSTGPIQGKAFLNAFSKWIPTQTGIKASDHYMAFTGYELSSAIGVANMAAACKGNVAVSVVQDRMQAGVANTAAHELGHSLNAAHDGDAGCDNAKHYLMAPTLVVPPKDSPSNIFTFSTCSVSSIKRYLSVQTCTRPAATTATSVLAQTTNGQFINLDLQCQMALGNTESRYCQQFNQGYSVCYGALCSLSNGYCRYILPLDGTRCGPGRVCRQGLCVSEVTARTGQNGPGTSTTRTGAVTATPPSTATGLPGGNQSFQSYNKCISSCQRYIYQSFCYNRCNQLYLG